MKNSPVTKAILNLIPYKTNGYFRPNTNCSEGLGAGLVFIFMKSSYITLKQNLITTQLVKKLLKSLKN
jgi:hypothetical protein